jgi:sulfide:quinone oxidoreductase
LEGAVTATASTQLTPSQASGEHHRVVIIGGGNAGISVAARLQRALKGLDVAIVEPSDVHYYQPLWTLVGGGVFKKEVTRRSEASVIPENVEWIREAVAEICPDESALLTDGRRRITYDYLVVAPGIQVNWSAIRGLPGALGKDGVCSNYSYESVESTWRFINGFKGGTAVFTQPATPIKCGGAPQKIAYLADEAFRRNGVRERSTIIFASGQAGIFAVDRYAKTLAKVVARKEIDARFRESLVAVEPGSREAVFQNLDSGAETRVHYDLLHVVPPMSAPDFIRQGPLAGEGGWVDVDKYTLQHVRYPNVFSLGDASSLPTSKTGAAIRKQAPVLVANLVATILGKPPAARYDGYTACPLVTGYGRLVMAEFDYDGKPQETFPFDQSKERWSMYQVKAHALPRLYWHGILKGRA